MKKETIKIIIPIIQFTCIFLFGALIIIATSWFVNVFKKEITECPNCECQCICPEQKFQLYEQRNLMDELYFLRSVDGSMGNPTFIPFFCEIYEECKNEK